MALTLNPTTGKFDVVNNKAVKIKIADAGGYYTGTEVETALQEIGDGTALDDRYVEVTGDTMTGVLFMGSDNMIRLESPNTTASQGIRFSTAHAGLLWGGTTDGQTDISVVNNLGLFSNTKADATGTWNPYIIMSLDGSAIWENTLQGSASDRILTLNFTSGTKVGNKLNPAADNVPLGETSLQWNAYLSGLHTEIRVQTAATATLQIYDCVLLCDASSNNIEVIFPDASQAQRGQTYHIKKIDSSANTVTANPAGSDTIDGDLTKVITSQWDSLMVVSDSTAWYII